MARRSGPPPARDLSPWHLLLAVPVVVPLLTFIYNTDDPSIGGVPAFYWIQFLYIVLGVTCTTVVYRMTTRKRG